MAMVVQRHSNHLLLDEDLIPFPYGRYISSQHIADTFPDRISAVLTVHLEKYSILWEKEREE